MPIYLEVAGPISLFLSSTNIPCTMSLMIIISFALL